MGTCFGIVPYVDGPNTGTIAGIVGAGKEHSFHSTFWPCQHKHVRHSNSLTNSALCPFQTFSRWKRRSNLVHECVSEPR